MPSEIGLFPPPLWYFLGSPKPQVEHIFYLSFEDALRDLLACIPVDRSRPILYPDFFCTDVTAVLESLGFKIESYPLDENLEVDIEIVKERCKKITPSIILIYHPLGKFSSLKADVSWVNIIGKDTIIIEDCADLFLTATDIAFINENHFIIDSLRKVSPIQGARLFGENLQQIKQNSTARTHSLYKAKAIFLHLLVRVLHLLTFYCPVRSILELKWWLFGLHSDCIGKSAHPASGCWFDSLLLPYLNASKVKMKKEAVGEIYYKKLETLLKRFPFLNLISVEKKELSTLRFFALRLKKHAGEDIAAKIERFSIFIDVHFEDSLHCSDCDYLLLPFPHTIGERDIDSIISGLETSLCE